MVFMTEMSEEISQAVSSKKRSRRFSKASFIVSRVRSISSLVLFSIFSADRLDVQFAVGVQEFSCGRKIIVHKFVKFRRQIRILFYLIEDPGHNRFQAIQFFSDFRTGQKIVAVMDMPDIFLSLLQDFLTFPGEGGGTFSGGNSSRFPAAAFHLFHGSTVLSEDFIGQHEIRFLWIQMSLGEHTVFDHGSQVREESPFFLLGKEGKIFHRTVGAAAEKAGVAAEAFDQIPFPLACKSQNQADGGKRSIRILAIQMLLSGWRKIVDKSRIRAVRPKIPAKE